MLRGVAPGRERLSRGGKKYRKSTAFIPQAYRLSFSGRMLFCDLA